MKKVLLASVALVAFGAAAAQAAEPVKLSIGGFATEWVGYAGNSKEDSNTTGVNTRSRVDQQDDININFVGSTKLDNGISVAVEVDTFGTQRNDTRNSNTNCGKAQTTLKLVGTTSTTTGTCGNSDTKRSFVTLSGGFGAVVLGEREDVGFIVHNSAPDVGIGLQDGYWFQWVVDPANHRTYSATNTSRYDARGNKITYVTPAFFGLAAGFTYVPSISDGSAGHTTITSSSDAGAFIPNGQINGTDFGNGDLYVAGLAYKGDFGGVSIKADAGVGQANIANLRIYQGGLQVGYAGFTLGGSILNRHVPDNAFVSLNGAAGQTSGGVLSNSNIQSAIGVPGVGSSIAKWAAFAGQSYDLGVSYATGPYAVSVGYFHDQTKNDISNGEGAAFVGGTNYGGGHDSTSVYLVSGQYILGPGVAWKSSVGLVDYANSSDTAISRSNENKGYIAVTGVRVDF